ncbi:MAG: aminopeptidase P family protein [Bacteroidales bacterium]|nr:aminopeptidase P family protein [Candidatus Cacconaster merdequi]
MNIFSERVNQVRSLGYDAVIVTGTDPHGSEYPASRWKQVEWLSGFTGEAGDIVVTKDHAGLWTDSRYFIQANAQLKDTGIQLHKTRLPESVPIPEYLRKKFPEGATIAVDGLCQSIGSMKELEGFDIVDVPDMLSRFWSDRPQIPNTPVSLFDESKAGESRRSKLNRLMESVGKNGCSSILISSLDEIAWLLNVRGGDIEYNPYVISYLLVSKDKTVWFVRDIDSVPKMDGVVNAPYESLTLSFEDIDGKVMVDPSSLNYSVFCKLISAVGEQNVIFSTSPVRLFKAVKNEKEIDALRKIYLEDGAAVERFLYWLECQVQSGDDVTEWEASLKLTELRSSIAHYHGNSFENISAYGRNAALPHYSTPKEGSTPIKEKGLYLVDSGGQYDGGTTDITRTVRMGRCSRSAREDYTLVLKGMIDLSMAVFPSGTPGCRIDALARNPLWQSRKNFGHGTGHGIGFYLGVHEGPQDIRQNLNPAPLIPGMVTSNEPGLYREGKYGIRHENVLLCVEDESNDYGKWLSFETLTCCHIDTRPVIRKLLTKEERKWLNNYNKSVYRRLRDRLPDDVERWLKKKTRKI